MTRRTLFALAGLAVAGAVGLTTVLAPDTGGVPERRRAANAPEPVAVPRPPPPPSDAAPDGEGAPPRPAFDPEVLRQLSGTDPRLEVVWVPTVGDPAALEPDDGKPLSPDVSGVERLVRRSGEAVQRCGQLHLPELRGQRRVVVRWDLAPAGGSTRIVAMAPDFVPDPEFWQPFVTCLQAELVEIRFADRHDPITVHWPVAW